MSSYGPAAPTDAARITDRPLPLTAVTLTPGGMLGGWQARNAHATIAHCIAQLEAGGALPNLRRVTGENEAEAVPDRAWSGAAAGLGGAVSGAESGGRGCSAR